MFKRSSSMVPATKHIEHLQKYLAEQVPKKKMQQAEARNIPEFLVVCWQFHNFFRTEYWCAVQLFRMRDDVQGEL